MSHRPPRSYDEIVRRTVPNPDSSWRPTKHQEHWASARPRRDGHALTPQEQTLCEDIHDALLAAGHDAAAIHCEVDMEHVVLRGRVRDRRTADRVLEIVRGVEGVRSVVDQLISD